MRILLTNDDSHDSPLFLEAIRELQSFGDVTVVVPAQEQSWKGKSMTRHGPLYVDRIDLHGHQALAVSGTPADCVNLALYNLLDERPDLVVSGVNLGLNTGLGFALASGTLGACFEANIAGLPALALSQQVGYEDYQLWNSERRFEPTAVREMADIFSTALPDVWRQFVVEGDASPTTWSINFPRHVSDSEVVRTRLGHSFYNRCFSRKGDQYHHAMARFDIDQAPDTDFVVLNSGRVSATHIDIRVLGQ